jgi:hypothetical protein
MLAERRPAKRSLVVDQRPLWLTRLVVILDSESMCGLRAKAVDRRLQMRILVHFATQVLDLAGRGLAFSVTQNALLAGFEKLLRPFVVEALRDPLTPAQLGDRVLAAQALPYNVDLRFRDVAFASCGRISGT